MCYGLKLTQRVQMYNKADICRSSCFLRNSFFIIGSSSWVFPRFSTVVRSYQEICSQPRFHLIINLLFSRLTWNSQRVAIDQELGKEFVALPYYHQIFFLATAHGSMDSRNHIESLGICQFGHVIRMYNERLGQGFKWKIKIFKTISPVVLRDFEACSRTLREECWLRLFENRILGGI